MRVSRMSVMPLYSSTSAEFPRVCPKKVRCVCSWRNFRVRSRILAAPWPWQRSPRLRHLVDTPGAALRTPSMKRLFRLGVESHPSARGPRLRARAQAKPTAPTSSHLSGPKHLHFVSCFPQGFCDAEPHIVVPAIQIPKHGTKP